MGRALFVPVEVEGGYAVADAHLRWREHVDDVIGTSCSGESAAAGAARSGQWHGQHAFGHTSFLI